MLYVNKRSFTCDFEGDIKTLMTECTILLHQFYNKVISETDKEFADKMLVEIGRAAAKTEDEVEEEVKDLLGKVLS